MSERYWLVGWRGRREGLCNLLTGGWGSVEISCLALVLTRDLPLQAQTCLFSAIHPPPPNAPSHLSAEVMTALMCSQTINSWALEEASSELAGAGCRLPGRPGGIIILLPVRLCSEVLISPSACLQMTTARTPSRPIRSPGCTVTWTWCTRAGSPPGSRRPSPLPPRSWATRPTLWCWSGSLPSTATSLKGECGLRSVDPSLSLLPRRGKLGREAALERDFAVSFSVDLV